MEFPKVFYRYVTTSVSPALIALGADGDPSTGYGTRGAPPVLTMPGPNGALVTSNGTPVTTPNIDNVFTTRVVSLSGVQVYRIGVVQQGPVGSASSTANLYVWEDNTGHWLLVNPAPITLVQNQVTFFDAISPCESVQNATNIPANNTLGGADYKLVVIANGTPTAGQYAFLMGALVNTP